MLTSALLIRGFGVQVPDGAPALTCTDSQSGCRQSPVTPRLFSGLGTEWGRRSADAFAPHKPFPTSPALMRPAISGPAQLWCARAFNPVRPHHRASRLVCLRLFPHRACSPHCRGGTRQTMAAYLEMWIGSKAGPKAAPAAYFRRADAGST
jgi:hypothetical protein